MWTVQREPRSIPNAPEAKLLIGMMAAARHDLLGPYSKKRREGGAYGSAFHYFFVSREFDDHCDYLAIDSESKRANMKRQLLERKSVSFGECATRAVASLDLSFNVALGIACGPPVKRDSKNVRLRLYRPEYCIVDRVFTACIAGLQLSEIIKQFQGEPGFNIAIRAYR